MNSLLLMPEEEICSGRYVITGPRAGYVFERHDLQPGSSLTVVLYRGRRGRGTVISCAPDRVEVEAELTLDPPPRAGIHLIVAVPRPQTVKKIVQLGCLAGLDSISFLNGPKVVKSYMQSKALEPRNLLSEVVKGLEQAVDCVPPEISVRAYPPKLFQELAERPSGARSFVADTRAAARPLSAVTPISPAAPVYLAVGPESGWDPTKVHRFLELGFEAVSLGARMLRVETAASFLVAQTLALRG